MQIKFLRDFYAPESETSKKFKWHKAGSIIEINADADNIPTNSFWYEQLRFEENKAFFEIQNPSSTTKKPK